MNFYSKILIILLVISLFSCSPSPREYVSESIYGSIETKEDTSNNRVPLEGVIVVAYWKFDGGLHGGSNMGLLHVMETESDIHGRFEFESWGPKKEPATIRDGSLKREAPGLIFFKKGFQPLIVYNEKRHDERKGNPVLTSEWTGGTIKLVGLEREHEQESLRRFHSTLEDTFEYSWEESGHAPKLFDAIADSLPKIKPTIKEVICVGSNCKELPPIVVDKE